MKSKRERLVERIIAIIRSGRKIVLKCVSGRHKGCYIGTCTNLAAGPDHADWTKNLSNALDIFNLEIAFAVTEIYSCKVYSVKA